MAGWSATPRFLLDPAQLSFPAALFFFGFPGHIVQEIPEPTWIEKNYVNQEQLRKRQKQGDEVQQQDPCAYQEPIT
jgi:hypothetical protein